MNPLQFKAHPLLYLSVELLLNPSAHSVHDVARLILLYLAVNLFWTPFLWWGAKKVAGFAPSVLAAYFLALASLVCYLGPMLTLLSDVLAHEFHLTNRFILVFCLFVIAQMLGALYAVAIRRPRNGGPIGLSDGLSISLLMWLASIPVSLALLGVNAMVKIF